LVKKFYGILGWRKERKLKKKEENIVLIPSTQIFGFREA
jgi:hypothetical protein